MPNVTHRQCRTLVTAAMAALLAACGETTLPTAAAPDARFDSHETPPVATELFISEYVEGSSNNKAIEIYNGTGAAIDLAAATYNLVTYSNGSAAAGLTIPLTGTVAAGGTYVIVPTNANATLLALANQRSGTGWFNGDDAVVLRRGTTVLDVVGQIGFDPGTEWGAELTSTADNTLRRKSTVCTGDTNGSDAFVPATEWDGLATDTFSGLGSHVGCELSAAPSVVSIAPANKAADVALDASIVLAFNRSVAVTQPWYTLACQRGGVIATTVSGAGSTRTIDPDAPLPAADQCTLTIDGSKVVSADNRTATGALTYAFSTAGTMTCGDPFTATYVVQGTGSESPLKELTVFTEGIVVADYEGPSPALRGYYIQDATGDGNASTSDALFVFDGSNANNVSVGDRVRVRGEVSDFQNQTQLSQAALTVCSAGNSVAPTDIEFPLTSADALEALEGMLVRVPQTMFVTEHFQLGRFGQVTLSGERRLQQPTDIMTPGAGANALQQENQLNRIIVDDAGNGQNPDPIVFSRSGEAGGLSASNTLRGGDQVTGLTGVMTFGWGGNNASPNAWRIRPLNVLGGSMPDFVAANPRPTSTPAVGGSLKVASFNVLNYFNTFDGLPDNVDNCRNGTTGSAADCRGADTQEEFDRQRAKTIAAVLKLDADVMGLVEIENDGYGENSAIADLVAGLNAQMGAGTWAFIDADAATGQVDALGDDAIKVGFIYRPSKVQPVGRTAVLNSVAFVNAGDGAPRNRPALVQAFEQPTGGRVVLAINHLKSKGSECNAPDANDGQGNCNAVRTVAAEALRAFLAADPTGTGDPDALILGDLNSYSREDPIRALEAGGFTNLRRQFAGETAYSYVFDGQWGSLDHALASATLLTQVQGFADLHINADEPNVLDYNTDFKTANLQSRLYAPDAYRTSDHDPVLVGLELRPHYRFGGFLAPLDADANTVNTANAGRVIPIKFSLGGFRGMDIFANGFPLVQAMDCETNVAGATVVAQTPGNAGLNYDAATDTYVFLWRTDARWRNSCQDVVIKFADGESSARARFSFQR